ncbi:VanW family protein [Rhodococcus zopfii]|uniref:VanW family protein n=1 Tax=Rhodococcus zopfii TaxID=43772 RepID=UPI00353D34DE
MSGNNGADERENMSGAVPPNEPETQQKPETAGDTAVDDTAGTVADAKPDVVAEPAGPDATERFVSMAPLPTTPTAAPADEPPAAGNADAHDALTAADATPEPEPRSLAPETPTTPEASAVPETPTTPEAPAVPEAPADREAAPGQDAAPTPEPAAEPTTAQLRPWEVPTTGIPAAPQKPAPFAFTKPAFTEPVVTAPVVTEPVVTEPHVEPAAEPSAPAPVDAADLAGDDPWAEDPTPAESPAESAAAQPEPAAAAPTAVDDSAPTVAIDMSAVRSAPSTPPRAESAAEPPSVPPTERSAGDLAAAGSADDAVTEVVPAVAAGSVPPPPSEPPTTPPGDAAGSPSPAGPPWRKIALAAGGVAAALAVLYGVDLAVTSGNVPRGVTVAGIEIGGKSVTEAETLLRDELGDRLGRPVEVTAGDTTGEVVPSQAGLAVDWEHTLDRIGSQPLNPFTRLASLFGSDEIGVASLRDDAALTSALEGVRSSAERAPREGTVVFEGATPVAVSPQPGQDLDPQVAADVFAERWAFGDVTLPVETIEVTVTPEAVDRALTDIAFPAVESDVKVQGRDNTVATLPRDRIGTILSFVPDGDGGLNPEYHSEAVIDFLRPQLAETEVEPKDARIVIEGSGPTVVPAVKGELVDWAKTLEPLPRLLAAPGDRTTPAVYAPVEPALTTEAAEKLGIREVIGEYTTGGFTYASGVNIRLAASEIDGALVKPGDTFSLNGYTGPRGAAQGYVESGIIEAGRPGTAVGGGISQLATTLYNATYFAGMEDVAHTEHSYYISRYPAAREATVYEGAIDLQFRNPFDTGVLIQTIGTSSDITVRIWGTKTVDVQSFTGDRTAFTSPNKITLPAGDSCIPSSGAQGFTVSDTRVITDAKTGAQLSRTTRTVKYDPVPIVECIEPESEREPAPGPERNPAGSPGSTPESGSSPTPSARPQPGAQPTTSRAPEPESATDEPAVPDASAVGE